MFHTYVQASTKKMVDIDRAKFLMDKKLFAQSVKAMERERDTAPRQDATYGPQWVWDYYCSRHFEKYGESFIPDTSPTWDQ